MDLGQGGVFASVREPWTDFTGSMGTSKNAQPVCQGLCTKPGAQHTVGTLTCLMSWNVPGESGLLLVGAVCPAEHGTLVDRKSVV